jgi:DNA-binding NtrC family response regulator
MQRSITGYTPAALEKVLRYPWPGNVRELENAIERACALATGNVIDVDDLPDEVRDHSTLTIMSEEVRPLRDVERDYILAVLERNQGSKTATAQQLRIGLATLRRKLKSYRKTG